MTEHKINNVITDIVSFSVTIDNEDYFVTTTRVNNEYDDYRVNIDKNGEDYSTFYMDSSGGRTVDDRADDEIEDIIVDIMMNNKMIVEF